MKMGIAMERSLNLLAMASAFAVTKSGDAFEVAFKEEADDYQLSAEYMNGEWRYYIGDVYNSGTAWVEIDVERLSELKAFCEALEGGE